MIALALAAACLSAAPARPIAHLSMAYTNALGQDLPFTLFSKGDWAPDPAARFVKLHLYFDEPISVHGLDFISKGKRLNPRLSIFYNFDQLRLQLDTNLAGEIPDPIEPYRHGDTLSIRGFSDSLEVRSLTINFESNVGFRLGGLDIFDPRGNRYSVQVPSLVGGTVEASSVLEPRSAYDPIYLFDSRFEFGWASDKQSKGVHLAFGFEQARHIEKIRIWNGYQRSPMHCWSNGRPRRIRFTGDGGYSAEAVVKDILGSQVIELPKPFDGKRLDLEVVNAYLGKSYRDLVISELRFFDGKDWFMLDPTGKLRDNMARNRADFAAAKAEALLNDSYVNRIESGGDSILHATLRIRADGSFYMSGDQGDEEPVEYFALGNYEMKKADSEGLKLRLFGLYYESDDYGDCNGCGRDCNRGDSALGPDEPRILQEFFTIKPAPGGRYDIVDEKGGKRIRFDRLRFSREEAEK